jgi:hypothetical protein
MSDVGEAFEQAGKTLAVSFADVVKGTGKMVSSASTNAAELVDIGGKTAVGVSSNAGKAATAAVGTVANTLATVQKLSERLDNYTEEAKQQAQIDNKTATITKEKQDDITRAKIDSQTQTKIQQIKNDLESKKKEIELEQARMLSELTAQQKQLYLKSQDNINKQQKAYYYGFTNSNPGPNDTGYISRWYGLSKWCYSYIPQYFEASKKKNIDIIIDIDITIDIDFPETLPSGQRSQNISAINSSTNSSTQQNITIGFETQSQTDWKGKPYHLQLPVIKFQESNDKTTTLFGKMNYTLIWFLCPTTSRGGRSKRRRTNRRRTNRRRTNRRRTNRRRTNRRRTNRRRTYKRH